jgi:hypothetical protein
MTDESVMSIGRMMGGLTSLTQLTLDISWWKSVSDNSVTCIIKSLSSLSTLSSAKLNLQLHSRSTISKLGFAKIYEILSSKEFMINSTHLIMYGWKDKIRDICFTHLDQ